MNINHQLVFLEVMLIFLSTGNAKEDSKTVRERENRNGEAVSRDVDNTEL